MENADNKRNKIIKDLELINKCSFAALAEMNKKSAGPLINFLFIMILKVSKISYTLKSLYPLLYKDRTIEFSIGVLLRTILMDAMLFLKVRKTFLQNRSTLQHKELMESLEEVVKFVYAEDVYYLIKDFKRSQQVTKQQLDYFIKPLIDPYQEYFEWNNGEVKLKRNGKTNDLKKIFEDASDYPFADKNSLLSLFVYYSKYDHVSNLILNFEHLDLNELIKNVDGSIVHMHVHLQLVIGFVCDFGIGLENCCAIHDELKSFDFN